MFKRMHVVLTYVRLTYIRLTYVLLLKVVMVTCGMGSPFCGLSINFRTKRTPTQSSWSGSEFMVKKMSLVNLICEIGPKYDLGSDQPLLKLQFV